jgi:ribosome biogenesis GTPase
MSELAPVEDSFQGTVFRSTGKWADVQAADGRRVECRLRGKFRMEGLRTTNPLAVGDHVTWIEEEDGTGVITEIAPRRNRIIRRSVNLSHEAHVVAANLDRAWLVVTLVEPATSSGFVDRFLVTAEAYGVPTTLLFNKVDVLLKLGEAGEGLLASWMAMYEQAGYECLPISAKEGMGLEEVRAGMQEGIHLVSGHSGVGKSTLLNALIPGLGQKTAEVSDVHDKGVHTTTFAEMFPLPDSGGFIIDTPGIKGFGLVRMEKETLHHHFPEMFRLLPDCKFHNCRHLDEPGCAVARALETGEVDDERYRNYRNMVEEFDEGPYRAGGQRGGSAGI